jgi:hypothetical protein
LNRVVLSQYLGKKPSLLTIFPLTNIIINALFLGVIAYCIFSVCFLLSFVVCVFSSFPVVSGNRRMADVPAHLKIKN